MCGLWNEHIYKLHMGTVLCQFISAALFFENPFNSTLATVKSVRQLA